MTNHEDSRSCFARASASARCYATAVPRRDLEVVCRLPHERPEDVAQHASLATGGALKTSQPGLRHRPVVMTWSTPGQPVDNPGGLAHSVAVLLEVVDREVLALRRVRKASV